MLKSLNTELHVHTVLEKPIKTCIKASIDNENARGGGTIGVQHFTQELILLIRTSVHSVKLMNKHCHVVKIQVHAMIPMARARPH